MAWTSTATASNLSWSASTASPTPSLTTPVPITVTWSASTASAWAGTSAGTPAQPTLEFARLTPVDLVDGGVNFVFQAGSDVTASATMFPLASDSFAAIGSMLTL